MEKKAQLSNLENFGFLFASLSSVFVIAFCVQQLV
ncbi:hypothetical protein YFHUAIHA_CDS0035 [Phage C48C1]|nr:hypothetical protein YFHUAIHA_CDS0035 [Phage C48C1]